MMGSYSTMRNHLMMGSYLALGSCLAVGSTLGNYSTMRSRLRVGSCLAMGRLSRCGKSYGKLVYNEKLPCGGKLPCFGKVCVDGSLYWWVGSRQINKCSVCVWICKQKRRVLGTSPISLIGLIHFKWYYQI